MKKVLQLTTPLLNHCPIFEEWDKSHLKNCRFVDEQDGTVRGWAALSAVSSRCVYAGVAEVSVYIDPAFSGKGIGYGLLEHLVNTTDKSFCSIKMIDKKC